MALSKSTLRRQKIKLRIRATVNGTAERPRLCVFRSNNEIYAQLINDDNGTTITSLGSGKLEKAGKNKVEVAQLVGASIAQLAVAKGITNVVFDRNGYLYHGRVKALADAARENGLQF